MNTLFTALLALSLLGVDSTPPAAPATNTAASAATADPVEQEYSKLIEMDEAALNDVQAMIKEAQAFEEKGAGMPRGVLYAKIKDRLAPVMNAYDEFLRKNPKHVDGYLAYGSFLNELGDEEEAIVQWEKARELAPNNPAPWNNLANIYGHIGPVRKAFNYYERAIELNPNEPVYIQNLATTTYLFRKDAREIYRITEEEVFNKALDLYRRAMKLDPQNLALATDYAQSYYGIRPMRVDDAVAAWNDALKLAKNDVERQGIYLHLARVQLNSGRFEDARKNLDLVTVPGLQELKTRLNKNLKQKQDEENGIVSEEPKEPVDNAALLANPDKGLRPSGINAKVPVNQ